jgi:hypothetical protein
MDCFIRVLSSSGFTPEILTGRGVSMSVSCKETHHSRDKTKESKPTTLASIPTLTFCSGAITMVVQPDSAKGFLFFLKIDRGEYKSSTGW